MGIYPKGTQRKYLLVFLKILQSGIIMRIRLINQHFPRYDLDFECISPANMSESGENQYRSDRETMQFDLRKVRESDVMLVNLRDIRQSIGACDEIFYAYMLGKPIIGFIQEELMGDGLVGYVHEWKYEQIDRIETGKDALEKACDYIKNNYRQLRNKISALILKARKSSTDGF